MNLCWARHVGKKANNSWVTQFITIFTLLLLWGVSPLKTQAQNPVDEGWSRPIDLAAGRQGKSFFPTIISDAAGGVHVFWDETMEGPRGTQLWVDYAYWNGETWTGPIDVFIGTAEWESAWGAQAAIDDNGILHTVWIDGFRLKYAQRHVSSPISTRSWTGQIVLAVSTGRIGPTAIALDDTDILHVLYYDAGAEEPGIYYLRSENGGTNWEAPVLISEPKTTSTWSQALQRDIFDLLPVGDTLHAAWIQDSKVYYSRGLARGREWSDSQVLQAANWPNLVVLDDRSLLLLATGTLPGDNTICYKLQNTSQDGGFTWNARHILMPHIRGCLGVINVVRAYDGSRHLITSAYRSEDLQLLGIYYSRWGGSDWQVPERATWSGLSNESFGTQIDFPQATISTGNILHVVFHVDEGRIWYIHRKLPSPPAPLLTYPPPTTGSTETTPISRPTSEQLSETDPIVAPTSTRVPRPTPTPSTSPVPKQVSRFDSRLPFTDNTLFPIFLSLVASAVLVSLSILWNFSRRRLR